MKSFVNVGYRVPTGSTESRDRRGSEDQSLQRFECVRLRNCKCEGWSRSYTIFIFPWWPTDPPPIELWSGTMTCGVWNFHTIWNFGRWDEGSEWKLCGLVWTNLWNLFWIRSTYLDVLWENLLGLLLTKCTLMETSLTSDLPSCTTVGFDSVSLFREGDSWSRVLFSSLGMSPEKSNPFLLLNYIDDWDSYLRTTRYEYVGRSFSPIITNDPRGTIFYSFTKIGKNSVKLRDWFIDNMWHFPWFSCQETSWFLCWSDYFTVCPSHLSHWTVKPGTLFWEVKRNFRGYLG